MELNYKAVGKRIKIARIHADMTQEALAGKIDLSPSHISNIETGTTKVSLATIANIANARSVTVDDLLFANQFLQDCFFGAVLNAVHSGYPFHLVFRFRHL